MRKKIRIFQPKLSWLAIPFALIFIAYFVVPLILTLIVSFWDYTEYSIIPDFIFGNYVYIFQGCFSFEDGLCLTFKTYISTFFFCFFTWLITLLLGFLRSLFSSFLCKFSTAANNFIFNLHYPFLDIKCNTNGILDSSSRKKWFSK